MKIKLVLIVIILIIMAVLALIFTACGKQNIDNSKKKNNNPHAAAWVNDKMTETFDSITRLDKEGLLYQIDYTYDYYNDDIIELAKKSGSIDVGCSAFTTYNESNEYLFCRNYDYMHADKDGKATGLNIIVRTAPKGKLKSISGCDGYWLNQNEYFASVLDDGHTDVSPMILTPYMCVDGMNEAGVAASLLFVDTKGGEVSTNQKTGKERIIHSVLLRYILDNAKNLEDAIKLAKSYDICSSDGKDLHIFVADKSGNSAVFEWRQYDGSSNQELKVTYTNAVTNFLVGYDDGEDAYREDGTLKEIFAKLSPTSNKYKYGYGHGYHRFNGIIAALERYILEAKNSYGIRNSKMNEKDARDILAVASQPIGTDNTSFTQYSAIYNLDNKVVNVYVQKDYSVQYTINSFLN